MFATRCGPLSLMTDFERGLVARGFRRVENAGAVDLKESEFLRIISNPSPQDERREPSVLVTWHEPKSEAKGEA